MGGEAAPSGGFVSTSEDIRSSSKSTPAHQELEWVRWQLSRLVAARLERFWSAQDESSYDDLTNREIELMERTSGHPIDLT
jgi:hypothetical protein